MFVLPLPASPKRRVMHPPSNPPPRRSSTAFAPSGTRIGSAGFDQLVPETIPKPGAVLLLVPPAEEKDQIAAQFVLEGLQNGDVAIVLGSEAGIRDLVRRAGNLGFDAEKSVSEGRLVPVDWEHVVAPKNGNHGGLPALAAALTAAAGSPKGAHG